MGPFESDLGHSKLQSHRYVPRLPRIDGVDNRREFGGRIRTDKVLKIKKQLAEGHYDIDKRLNTVFDRFFEDLLR